MMSNGRARFLLSLRDYRSRITSLPPLLRETVQFLGLISPQLHTDREDRQKASITLSDMPRQLSSGFTSSNI